VIGYWLLVIGYSRLDRAFAWSFGHLVTWSVSQTSGIWHRGLAVVGLLLMISCSNEKEELNTTANYDYFPLETGKYWVYEVDSTVYFDRTRRVSSKTWVREQITDFFINNTGDTVYRVDRYERKDPAQPWEIRQVVSLLRNARQAIRTENNLPLIKLVFPLRNYSRWNSAALTDPNLTVTAGNRIALFKLWETKVESLDEPMTLDNKIFPETATISYADRDALIEYRFVKESYAKGVGLLRREWWILDSQCNTCPPPWEAKAESGFILKQQLIEHN
jgi:hypothetical protein